MSKFHNLYSKTYMDVKEELLQFEKNNRYTADFFRDLTEAMIGNLKDLYVIDQDEKVNDEIEVIFGNQERAVAKMNEDRTLKLPLVSVTIAGNVPTFERKRPDFNLITERIFVRSERRAYRLVSFSPKPVDLVFRINLYSKYLEDLNQLTEQIEDKFQPFLRLETKNGNSTHAFIDSSTDQSAFSVADRQDRVVQKSFSITAQGYIPRPKFILASNGKLKPLSGDRLEREIVESIAQDPEPRLNF